MTKKIYPGMLDARIEYFQEDGDVFKLKNGTVKRFDDVEDHKELRNIIEHEKGLRETLTEMCGDNERDMQKKLASCRFGALNFEADFDYNGNHSHDHIDCSKRGSCIGENIVCKPLLLKGSEISVQQLEILRGCAGNMTNETLAGHVKMPLGSFNVLKQKTYRQINIQTKQETAILLIENGLL